MFTFEYLIAYSIVSIQFDISQVPSLIFYQFFMKIMLTRAYNNAILYIYYIYNIIIYNNKGENMNIIISNSNKKPIYEQIASQIKNQIISGELKEGDALPSMRLLAKELRISVITTKRAYEELEREGFIDTATGRGSFVASRNIELIKEEQLKIVEQHLQKSVEIAKSSGISLKELTDVLGTLYEEE